MSDETTDYAAVEIPNAEETPREEWTPEQRRASLLDAIREARHADALNLSAHAREFGVDRSTIWRDVNVHLAEYVTEQVGGDRHTMRTEAVFRKCVRELLADGEWKDAATVARKQSDWIAERVELRRLEERIAELQRAQEASDPLAVGGNGGPRPGPRRRNASWSAVLSALRRT